MIESVGLPQYRWQDVDMKKIGIAVGDYVPTIDTVTKVMTHDDVKVPSNVIYVRFSKPFLARYLCRSIHRQTPLQDTILGARVTGTCTTTGETELKLVDSPQVAVAELTLVGANHFTDVATHDPVRIYSRGTTTFHSQAILRFDGRRVVCSEPVTQVATHSTVTGMTTSLPGLRRRIALRVADRREAEVHGQAECITNARTKARISQVFAARLNAGVATLSQKLRQQFARLPLDGRYRVQEIRGSTTADRLELVLIGRGDGVPELAEAPRAMKGHPDIEIHVHSALVQKAILDPVMRQTLTDVFTGLVDRPVMRLVSAAKNAKQAGSESKGGLKLQWADAEGTPWFSVSWREGDDGNVPPGSRSK
jgi:hypothetical protein